MTLASASAHLIISLLKLWPFVAAIAGFYLIFLHPPIALWRSYPTLDDYLRDQQGQTNPTKGVSCIVCGSRSLKNWGVRGAHDRLRLHICNNCGTTLFRSKI